jgi:D-glycero-D-manno-heptose 1,7-bisphosphate phosphatase
MTKGLKKAVFLDRDGVLNVDLGYTYKLTDLRLVDGMIDGLKALREAGFLLVMITNQSGVARGFFSLDHVHAFNDALTAAIKSQIPEFKFDAVMICPHHTDGKIAEFTVDCACRKPGTKLITDAAAKLPIDLKRSWLVGDKSSDIDCANNAGLRGIQVTHGGKQYPQSKQSFATVKSLKEAADIIIKQSL